MRQVMVRYKVKPERVEENEELVRAVYDEFRQAEPADMRYATFKLDIEDRTDEGPVVSEIDQIGSFRLVG